MQQQIESDKKLAEMLSLESDEENDLISIDGIQTTKSKSLCEALQKLSVKHNLNLEMELMYLSKGNMPSRMLWKT